MTIKELRKLNGNFPLCCQLAGDKLNPDEVPNLTDYEIDVLYNRTEDPSLKLSLTLEKRKRRAT